MSEIEPIIQVLSQRTFYNTPSIFSYSGYLLSEQLHYPTINEEYVIQQVIQNHQAKKKQENSLWRIGGAALGLALGLGDGFQIGDMIGSIAGSALAGGISNALQDGDDAKLRELNLEWVNTPESYLYHRKRHRGDAVRRLLLIAEHPTTKQPCTVFGIQFPDGYVAHLALMQNFDTPMFAIAGSGFDTDWVQEKLPLGKLTTDLGVDLPVELWRNNYGSHTNSLRLDYR